MPTLSHARPSEVGVVRPVKRPPERRPAKTTDSTFTLPTPISDPRGTKLQAFPTDRHPRWLFPHHPTKVHVFFPGIFLMFRSTSFHIDILPSLVIQRKKMLPSIQLLHWQYRPFIASLPYQYIRRNLYQFLNRPVFISSMQDPAPIYRLQSHNHLEGPTSRADFIIAVAGLSFPSPVLLLPIKKTAAQTAATQPE